MVSIYRLFVEGEDLCYVGSTALSLEKRLASHRKNSTRENRLCTSHILFYLGEVQIELLESCNDADRKERERYWIENTPNVVNKCIPGRTDAEYDRAWSIANRDYKNEYKRARRLRKKLLQQE
jgi:hypothetical protein